MKKVLIVSSVIVIGFLLVLASFWLQPRNSEGPKREVKSDSPGEAREWRALAWREEDGEINDKTIAEAVSNRDEYLAQQEAEYGFSDGSVARMNWVPRGPTNVGGRTRALVIHPTDTSTMWAGSVGGGVWKTTDSGESWFGSNGNIQNFAVSSLAIAPDNPDVLYAGTGEGFGNQDAIRGDGIYKSLDGGVTWERIPSTNPSDTQVPNRFAWRFVDRISIAHDDSSKILAATAGGIMRTEDGGGTDWSLERAGIARFVAFNPSDSQYAVAHTLETGAYTALYYDPEEENVEERWKIASRGGGPFQISTGDSRIELTYAKANPDIVYAFNPISTGTRGVVSRSEDGGRTYSLQRTSFVGSFGTQTWYNNALWASHPEDPDLLVVGAVPLFRSSDGGDTLTQIAQGDILTTQPHPDFHCIVEDPDFDGDDNKRVFVCNDGGIYVTDDITTASTTSGWQPRNNGYQSGQYYGAAGRVTTGPVELIFGGLQDNGTLRLESGSTQAVKANCCDGGFSAVDPVNTDYCYGQTQTFGNGIPIYRHENGCSASGYIGISEDVGGFIAPLVLDLNDSTGNRMFVGGGKLWRSVNVRTGLPPTWLNISTRTATISTIAVAPGDSNIVWIAEGSPSKIYKTNDALNASPSPSPTFTPVDDNGGMNPIPRNTYVPKILIDQDDSDIVYVAFGGFPEPSPSPVHGNLWRTYDGGAHWEDISSNLPRVPIRGIARHPNDASKLYVGTEIGVYKSHNTGASWEAVLDGPANVSVDELTFMHGSTILLAATHGRGIWTCDVDAVSAADDAPFDYDGDGRTDFSVFRPSTTTWHLWRSLAGYTTSNFGQSTDIPVGGDFDADGKADITVFRPGNGTWYWINSSNSTSSNVQYGANGDVPMPGDFDEDGYSDQAVFRPSSGIWYLNRSDEGSTSIQWGISTDLPVVADFDGDDFSDIGVFRLDGGLWYLHESTSGNTSIQWGQTGDVPVAGDYDGDGEAEVGVWRPADPTGTWHLNQSSAGYAYYPFGGESDIPVPGDYDGDGSMDVAFWAPGTGVWHLRQSSNGYREKQFGASIDIPIPSYVLYRSAEDRSALRNAASPPPPVDPSDKRWRAPGIPAKEFVRKSFKPGTVAGLSNPETVKRVLGGRSKRKARAR